MNQLVRCPAGTLYDAAVHAECPCPHCWADRSFATLVAKVKQVPNQETVQKSDASSKVVPQKIIQAAFVIEQKSERVTRTSKDGRTFVTRNFLIGIAAAVIVATATYFGTMLWVQNRVEHEIESAFSAMRENLGIATYDQVKFRWWGRTVNITNISLQAKNVFTPTMKIGQLVVSGGAVTLPEWFSAQRVEITDVELKYGNGNTARVDGLTFEDLSLTLSKLHFPDFLALAGASPQFDKSVFLKGELVNKIAEASENIRIGKFEMRGMTLNDSQNVLKFTALRFNKLENGQLAEFILEGVKLTPPVQSVNARRLALKGINIAGLLRKSAQFSVMGQPPTPSQTIEFLPLLEGVEMDGFTAPDERVGRSPGQLFRIESFRASWGRPIGSVPSSAHVTANVTAPISTADQGPFKALAEAGHNSLTFVFDVGGAWAERTQTFVITPAIIEFSNLFTASVMLSFSNVPPNVFVVDPTRFTLAASVLETGPIDFSLRDTGGLDLWIAQVAKTQGVSLVTARKMQIDNMYKNSQMQSQLTPDFQRLVNVAGRFIETPGATLRINLTPKGKVNLVQTIELVKANPAGALSALAQFNLDAIVNR